MFREVVIIIVLLDCVNIRVCQDSQNWLSNDLIESITKYLRTFEKASSNKNGDLSDEGGNSDYYEYEEEEEEEPEEETESAEPEAKMETEEQKPGKKGKSKAKAKSKAKGKGGDDEENCGKGGGGEGKLNIPGVPKLLD